MGKCGKTKTTKKNKTKNKSLRWDPVYQQAFDNVKAAITKEVVLAYPDFSKSFEIYMDTSAMQLGAVIAQENRPIAFFRRKLFKLQQKYSVTKGWTLRGNNTGTLYASYPRRSTALSSRTQFGYTWHRPIQAHMQPQLYTRTMRGNE